MELNPTLLSIYESLFRNGLSNLGLDSNTANMMSSPAYSLSRFAIFYSLAFYPVIVTLIALSYRFHRLTLPSGILTFFTGIMWIFGVESLKSTSVQQASSPGGLCLLSGLVCQHLARDTGLCYGLRRCDSSSGLYNSKNEERLVEDLICRSCF